MPTLDELFEGVDEASYKAKVKEMTIEDLRYRECKRHRQINSGSWSVGLGLGGAIPTLGVSLLGSAYGGRRMYLASKKFDIVAAEIDVRHEAHYQTRKRDWMIPVAFGAATLGIGLGVEAIASDFATQAVSGAADHGLTAFKDVVHDPSSAMAGVGHGLETAGHHLVEAAHSVTEGFTQATACAASDVANAGASNAAEAVGEAIGESIALFAGKETAEGVLYAIPTTEKAHFKKA